MFRQRQKGRERETERERERKGEREREEERERERKSESESESESETKEETKMNQSKLSDSVFRGTGLWIQGLGFGGDGFGSKFSVPASEVWVQTCP